MRRPRRSLLSSLREIVRRLPKKFAVPRVVKKLLVGAAFGISFGAVLISIAPSWIISTATSHGLSPWALLGLSAFSGALSML